MIFRRPTLLFAASLAVAVLTAPVQAEPTMEQLKASYEETVRQLQQSQDRKNQLANENEQLKTRIAELEEKLNAINAQAMQAEFLRGQYVAWQTFIERYPLLLKRFRIFAGIGTPPAVVASPEPFFDPEWPFSAAARIEDASTISPRAPASATTVPALVQMFRSGSNHWCALCAAAAQRKAEAEKSAGDAIAAPPADDLMLDLPPR
jgi:hypothetical protein